MTKVSKLSVRPSLLLRMAQATVMSIMVGTFLVGCADNDIAEERRVVSPPDLSKASKFLSFAPDSGGVGTQLVIKGENLGTDTAYLRVTVNGKRANIVGVNNDHIYAIVPARADNGLVKVFVGKGDQAQELTGDTPFRYFFKRNVSTVAGQNGKAERADGEYTQATFRRPWALLCDKDDAIFEMDEGRGTNKDGALRRLYEGNVETLIQNNAGPFQSPTAAAFNAAQDTMYMVHLYNPVNCTSKVGLVAITRAGGFMDTRALVRMDNPQCTGIAVHPTTGDIIFNNQSDGYLYRYVPNTDLDKAWQRLKRVGNKSGTELKLVFSPDGKYLYEIIKNRHCIYRTAYDAATRTLDKTDELWAGQWDKAGYQNGVGTAAQFDTPSAGAFDEDGNLYIADKNNHCIRKITPDGTVSLYAGIPKESGYKDGLPDVAKFNQPEGLTILSDQSIIVADRENQVIRKVVVE